MVGGASWNYKMIRSRNPRSVLVGVCLLIVLVLQVHVRAFTSQPAGWSRVDRRARSDTSNLLLLLSSRRDYFVAATSSGVFSALLVGAPSQQRAHAVPFGGDSHNRRQKELCIVNILRLQYWAQTVAGSLELSHDIEQRKRAYLEARLGAKAMVAKKQKVGGGATARVFLLVSLGIQGCLDDLSHYAKDKKKVDQLKEDLTEALASIVEFDGLETTQDPSPRSSLTLGQYNDQKALFVRRMLSERIIPLTQELVDYFGKETRAQCEAYVREYYAAELPPIGLIVREVPSSATASAVDQERPIS